MKKEQLRRIIQITCVLIFSCFLLLLTLYKPLHQDEGVFLVIGKFIGNGTLPYRDIFDHKPPGIYYLNYFLLEISGSILFVKIGYFLINIISAVLITKIYGRIAKKPQYLMLPAIWFLIMLTIFEGNFLIAEVPMTLCLLAALYFFFSEKNGFLIGLFCALAIIFKQTAFVSSLVILISTMYSVKKSMAWSMVGFILPLLTVLVYLIMNNIYTEAIEQIFWLNLCCYPKESLSDVSKYLSFYFVHVLPILILAILEIVYILKNLRGQTNKLVLVMLTILPIPLLLIRHYPHYWLQIIPFLAILAAIETERLWKRNNLYLSMLIIISVALMVIINFRWLLWQFDHNYTKQYLEQKRVVSYLQKNHYREIIAENQFSFFAFFNQQKPPGRYLYITEINNASNQAENETIALLKQNKNIVVFWPENRDFAYAKKLQQYILEYFHPEIIFSELGLVIYIQN